MPKGGWRLFYKDEGHGSHTWFSESSDLYHWSNGKAIDSDLACEGANAFSWKGSYWMITDAWDGQAVYRCDNALDWKRQKKNLLKEPGLGLDDMDIGRHADVVVSGDRAYLFYFTHPGGVGGVPGEFYASRRSSIQVTELDIKNGRLTCDRNQPTHINLLPEE